MRFLALKQPKQHGHEVPELGLAETRTERFGELAQMVV